MHKKCFRKKNGIKNLKRKKKSVLAFQVDMTDNKKRNAAHKVSFSYVRNNYTRTST